MPIPTPGGGDSKAERRGRGGSGPDFEGRAHAPDRPGWRRAVATAERGRASISCVLARRAASVPAMPTHHAATAPRATLRLVTPEPAAPRADPLAAAYRELHREVRAFVARRAAPADVDDLTQEIFLRLHERAAELHDASRIAPWAFRVARSVVVDHHRRRRPSVSLDDAPEPALEDDATNLNEEVASWLRPMLALLPAEYAEAVELTELGGLGQRELAERLGLSVSGAKSRVQRGRKLLEGVLRACCDFEIDARGNVVDCAPRALTKEVPS